MTAVELTILMPCLNEAETVQTCIRKALAFLAEHDVAGEVLVADNGSTDGSRALANAAGARVVPVAERGYGAALLSGIQAAEGRFVIMGDADDSYDLSALMPFLEALRAGADLVMGNRFAGGIAPGAMSGLHRYLGNPVLSFLGRRFFRIRIGDFHCGLRGFRRDRALALSLTSQGMEFASEMVVKSALGGLRIAEVPTTLAPDGRSRPPHLRTWRDGWRHLRFLLLYSPRWLFFYPGLALTAVSLVVGLVVSIGPTQVGRVTFDVDTLVAAGGGLVAGYQAVVFAVLTRVYAAAEGFLPAGPRTRRVQEDFRLEWGLLAGALLVVAGLVGLVVAVLHWNLAGFGRLNPSRELRLVVPSVVAAVVGCQTAFASLVVSVLGIRHRTAGADTPRPEPVSQPVGR
ncbi:MAG: hypothetical protein V7637_956 [Mycobacteriales bacterium]|jgi:hypothetical protein